MEERNEIQNEFKKNLSSRGSILKPRTPQIGTGKSIRDELEHDNVDINEIGDEILQFLTPKTENTYAALAVNRDKNLRIEDKILISSESNHVLKYLYDEDGRLQAVKYSGKPTEIYHHNQLGQRTYSHVSGSDKLEYSYNNLGQLVRAGKTTYTYDEDGDLSEKNSPEGTTRYKYLKSGQLCEVHLPDGTHIEYRFDKRGFRAAKHTNGQLAQRYLWKDLITLATVEDAEGTSKFHYNEHGRCMGMERKGQVSLFATDQLGSIFSVADSSGSSVQEILYDSFGGKIQDSNPEHDLVLGFGGGLYDSDTGLIHFGYREYDPVIGRFISPDPLGHGGGDIDLYGYCLDDPINFGDRTGLFGEFGAGYDGTSGSGYSGVGGNNTTSGKNSSNSTSSGLGGSGNSLGGEGRRSSNSGGYRGNDFGPGYNGTSGSAYGPTKDGWGYNTDPGGSHFNGGNSRGEGTSSPTKSSAQHAREMEARVAERDERERRKAALASGENIVGRALEDGFTGMLGGASLGSLAPGIGTAGGGIVGGMAGFTSGLLKGTITEAVNKSDLSSVAKAAWGIIDEIW